MTPVRVFQLLKKKKSKKSKNQSRPPPLLYVNKMKAREKMKTHKAHKKMKKEST